MIRNSPFVLICLAAATCFGQNADKQDQSSPALKSEPQSIVVTGTWAPVALDEVDRSVNEYKLPNMPLLFGTAVDAFASDSSVFVSPRGANGTQADISIRGGSFGQTLFLLDGMRLNDVQSAHYNSDLPIPLDAIDRLEILRGSGSTLYGSDAIGGAINILTRQPAVQNGIELKLRGGAGNFGTNEESGFIEGTAGRVSERIAIERDASTGFRNDRDYRNLALSSETWLRTGLGLSRAFLGMDDRPFGADQFYGPYNSWERTKTWLADFEQDLGANTEATFSYRRHTDLFELFRTNPDYYTNRHEDYQYDYAVRRHDRLTNYAHVYYGGEGLHDHVDSNNLGEHTRNQGALYADFDVRAIRRASFTIGAREEFYTGNHAVFAPSAAGGYWVTSKLKLRGSASRAFRLPTYTDLYYHDPGNVGNPALQAEKAWSYEGGADLHIRDRWKLSLTGFERRERDDIDYVRASSTSIWRATNFDRLNFTGLEASADLSLPYAETISIQFTGLKGNQQNLAGLQSKYVFNYPTQEAVVSWQRYSSRGWIARIRGGAANQYQRDAYFVMDASAAWTRSRLHPYARLTNLTDTSYQPVYGVVMPGRAALVGLEICAVCRTK